MSDDNSSKPVRVDAGMGIIWFIGWMFTIAFAKLLWWEAILGLIIWPYYLGLAVALAPPCSPQGVMGDWGVPGV